MMGLAMFAALLVVTAGTGWGEEEMCFPAKETVLVIVDVQNDFATPGGVFASERSGKVIEPIKVVLEKARKVNVSVIYTQDHHRVTDREIRYGRKPHTLEGTFGEEIVEAIKPKPPDYVVQKNSFDPWFSNDQLEQILTRRLTHIRYAVVTGLVSSICVYATANGFGLRGYEVILPEDCTEAGNGRDILLRQMKMLYSAKVTDSRTVQFK